jgi:hypothetical protein
MKKLLLLLLLATPAFAEAPVRESYPNDYKPQSCAPDTAAVCQSFPRERLAEYGATFRGFDIRPDWMKAHWDEQMKLFQPLCAKIANCFTVRDNDWVYCLDLMRSEFLGTCSRFPAGSDDHKQCSMFSLTYYIGFGARSELHRQAQECVAAQPPASSERTLQAWIEPTTYDKDFNGEMTVYAYDTETHIPVRARLTIDGGELRSTEGPIPTAGYISIWRAGLAHAPNAQGHRDIVAPTATLQATGYKTLTVPIPIDVPKAVIEMTPAAAKLKTGINTITVHARDAATGAPVEMRVMAGSRVLGNTNGPLKLELRRGTKRPEIWVTSLYDRYSDAVVAP